MNSKFWQKFLPPWSYKHLEEIIKCRFLIWKKTIWWIHSGSMCSQQMSSLFPDPPSFLPGPPRLIPGPPSLIPGPPSLIPGPPSLIPDPPGLIPGPPSLIPDPPSLLHLLAIWKSRRVLAHDLMWTWCNPMAKKSLNAKVTFCMLPYQLHVQVMLGMTNHKLQSSTLNTLLHEPFSNELAHWLAYSHAWQLQYEGQTNLEVATRLSRRTVGTQGYCDVTILFRYTPRRLLSILKGVPGPNICWNGWRKEREAGRRKKRGRTGSGGSSHTLSLSWKHRHTISRN